MFIPDKLFYEFYHNGVLHNGFIFASPDIKFIVAKLNEAFLNAGADLQLSIFPKETIVDVYKRNFGFIKIGTEQTIQVEPVGEDSIEFNEPVGPGSNALEMFFPKQATFNFANSWRLSKAGLVKIDFLGFPEYLPTPVGLGASVVQTMMGSLESSAYRLPANVSKWVFVAFTQHELYPDIAFLNVGANVSRLQLENVPVPEPAGFPQNRLEAFVYNTTAMPNGHIPTISLSAEGKLHISGLREKALELLQQGQISQIEYQQFLLDLNVPQTLINAKLNVEIFEVDYVPATYPPLDIGSNSLILSNTKVSATRSAFVEIRNFTLTDLSLVEINASASFDIYASLFSGTDPLPVNLIEADDDDGPGTNSLIRRFLPAGDYSIEVGPFGSAVTGAQMTILLSVEQVPTHPIVPLGQLTTLTWDGSRVADISMDPYASIVANFEVTTTSTIDITYTSNDHPYELYLWSGTHPGLPGETLIGRALWNQIGSAPWDRQYSNNLYADGPSVLEPGIYTVRFVPYTLTPNVPAAGDTIDVLIEALP